MVGGGLLIGYGLFKPRDLLGDPRILPTTVAEIALNAWLKIGADNRITIAVPRVEMGQGVHTALPMLVAEELEIGWSAVNIVQAPIDSVYGNIAMLVDGAPFDAYDNGWLAKSARWSFARLARTVGLNATGGSTSIRDAWLPMRAAGAAARQMLTRAAGVRLGVDSSDLVAANGEVVHAPTARALSYGALAADAAKLEPPTPIELKAPADFAIIGKPVRRLDVPGKVSGDAQFGIDVYHDDMLFASVRSCPVFGGTLVRVDRDALMAQPGVSAVVELHDAVAVVAQTYWHAQEALRNADIEFNHEEHAALSSAGIAERYATAMAEADFPRYENFGDVDAALDSAEHVSAEYRAPFLAHACMEPMNCTVRVDGDRADVWFGNQAPDLLRWIAAQALDLPADKVDVHTMLLGGGFGRRGEPDIVRQAARIARQVPGRAVKLLWSREQDLRHDVYRPAALSRFRARLDDGGRIIAWHNRVACPSVLRGVMTRAFPGVPAGGPDRTSVDGAAFLPYTAEHRRVEHTAVPVGVPVGFWRSVGHSFNAFFTECFVDELALAAGLDPSRVSLE